MYKRFQDKHFVGVCLDLDIVEQNEDSVELRKNLEEAARGYLEAVIANNLDDELLNKTTTKKYQKIVEEMESYLHQFSQISSSKRKLPLQDSQFFTKNVNDLVRA